MISSTVASIGQAEGGASVSVTVAEADDWQENHKAKRAKVVNN